MIIAASLTVPAGTAEADPATEDIDLVSGLITRAWLTFPPGCAGRVRCAFYYHERQVLPEGENISFIGDAITLDMHTSIEIEDVPYVLQLRAWSPDATYDHILYATFSLSPEVLRVPALLERVEVPDVSQWLT